jgi:cytochrome c oxidase subunit I
MTALAETHGASAPSAKKVKLFPSILSGLVVGLVAAIVAGIIGHHIASPQRGADTTLIMAYAAFAIFFLVGMGAFSFPLRWGLGRPDTSHDEELRNAGRDEGVWRYFRFCTDHKVVGVQYLCTVFVLFLVGGVASWMIRAEQAQSGAKLFTPATYNTIVGMHGIIMIATTIIMVSATFGNFIIPIMIGANDMAFPRLNALSYWTLFPVIPILLSTLVLGGFPTGWTGYAPLADQAQLGMDAYSMTIIIFGTSIALSAVNIAATIITMRAPGMTWGRLPITVWGSLISTTLGLIVFPTFVVAQTFVVLDRVFGTSFYQANMGGNNWLYEELFWFMGHPEVYVILLPAIGPICDIISTFCRKPLFGYKLVVAAEISIFIIGMGVWMHHIYWSGANTPLDTPMMLGTEIISIPTGLIFLALIGTLWRARIRFEPPMLFALAFIVNFLIGGVTGLYLADVPTDTIYHGDMFVVAHFHFTLVGGPTFAFLGAVYYWFPKMFGKQLNPRLGKIHFWLMEIGFLGVFLPLFYAGLQGEPRWQAFISSQFVPANFIASCFAVVLVAGVAVFAYNLIMTWAKGPKAVANPWGSRTLEWMTSSPPPLVNFEHIPVVTSGPYDYGMGGSRMMAAPAMAGASVDSLPEGHSLAHHHAHDHATAVRIGTIWLVISDIMFVLAILLGFVYLKALNTQGAFRSIHVRA